MTYQIKVQLQDVENPPVWRRFLIPNNTSFDDFHKVIQCAFGWKGYKLYTFSDQFLPQEWIISNDEGRDWMGDTYNDKTFYAEKTAIGDFLNSSCPSILYVYDNCMNWIHIVTLENSDVKECEDPTHAHCIAGEGICPPEICRGPRIFSLMRNFISEHPQWAKRIAKRKETEIDQKIKFDDEYLTCAYTALHEAGQFYKIVKDKPDFSKIDLDKIEARVAKIPLNQVEFRKTLKEQWETETDSEMKSILEFIHFGCHSSEENTEDQTDGSNNSENSHNQ